MTEKEERNKAIESAELIENESLKNITTRKSIRKYTTEKISDAQIKTLLNAGFCAPSARNIRPWHFIVLNDHNHLSEISNHNIYTGMLKQADLCIVVCGDYEIQPINEFILADTCAATQNILLAAHGIGLGAVWCGVVQGSDWEKYLITELKLPNNMKPISVIAIGDPAEERVANERYETEKVHYEIW